MMRLLSGTVISALALASCGSGERAEAPGSAGPVSVAGDVVRFDGPITAQSAEAFQEALDENPGARTLSIASEGGEAGAAVRMGEAVRRRDLTVSVRGQCLQACAGLVFLPAPRKTVEGEALVAFSNPLAGMVEIYAHHSRPMPEPGATTARTELAAYRGWRIPASALTDVFAGMEPYCVEQSGAELIPRRRATYWVPPRAWVERVSGSAPEGFWPASQAEAERVLEALPGPAPAIRYGEAPSWRETFERLTSGAGCS